MSKINFSETAVNINDVIDTNGTAIASYDDSLTENATERGLGFAHQPFIISIDTSGSMESDAGNGMSKLEACKALINNLPNSKGMRSLSVTDKDCVDMLVTSFHDNDVYINSNWRPLSMFEGINNMDSGSTTPLYKAIAESIQATRVMRHSYAQSGIECKRPQIFVYTDGLATDDENRAEAKKLCQEYAGKTANKVKLFVVLVPGSMSESQIQTVSNDLLDLCDNVTLIKIDDCTNGLPATFSFLTSSVVVGASSSIGADMFVRYDRNNNGNMMFANASVQDGKVSIGQQIAWAG